MYLINKIKNQIQQVSEKKFSELGFREREHLQEWVAKLPSCLGEELLIIQKEFSGFDETSERLDLLALDKDGNLVIIENKLDDSGRDVVWQALKYASYCSSLTKNQIIEIYQEYLQKSRLGQNAQENVLDFFEKESFEEIELNKPQSQRIFLVAGNFRKEVTSTALWLLDYNIRVKCFKVTPFQMGAELLLDITQIVPMKDSEELIIRMAEKNQETLVTREKVRERVKINQQFWSKFLDECNQKNDYFSNFSPSKDSWLWKSAGISGLGYVIVVSGSYARVEFQFNTPDSQKNKQLFDRTYPQKKQIEKEIGLELKWDRRDSKRSSAISYQLDNVSVYNEEDWDNMINFLIEHVKKFIIVFGSRIPEIKKIIK